MKSHETQRGISIELSKHLSFKPLNIFYRPKEICTLPEDLKRASIMLKDESVHSILYKIKHTKSRRTYGVMKLTIHLKFNSYEISNNSKRWNSPKSTT